MNAWLLTKWTANFFCFFSFDLVSNESCFVCTSQNSSGEIAGRHYILSWAQRNVFSNFRENVAFSYSNSSINSKLRSSMVFYCLNALEICHSFISSSCGHCKAFFHSDLLLSFRWIAYSLFKALFFQWSMGMNCDLLPPSPAVFPAPDGITFRKRGGPFPP